MPYDSVFGRDWDVLDTLKSSVKTLEQSQYSIHIRATRTGQITEIYSANDTDFSGVVTNYTIKLRKSSDFSTEAFGQDSLVCQQQFLDPTLCRKVAQQFLESGFQTVPTDSQLSSWKGVYPDCGSFKLEVKHQGRVTYQQYHCPWGRPDSTQYLDLVYKNYHLIYDSLYLDSIYRAFERRLPRGVSYTNSGHIVSYHLTEEEVLMLERDRPRREYLKSISDTVNNYIEAKIAASIKDTNDVPCSCKAYVSFDKNGRSKKIRVHKPEVIFEDDMLYRLERQREIRQCSRQVRRAFRNVDLSFLNSPYRIYREVTLSCVFGFYVLDNRIY